MIGFCLFIGSAIFEAAASNQNIFGLNFLEGHFSKYFKETIAIKVSEIKVVGHGGFV